MAEPSREELIYFVSFAERAITFYCKRSRESPEYVSRKIDLLSVLARRAQLYNQNASPFFVQGELFDG